jgi:photosystem II stability/assembly factor-like uncharacterized protein
MKIKIILIFLICFIVDIKSQWYRQTFFTSKNLSAIFFVDSLHGWIGGLDESIFITTNGGNNWTEITDSLLYGIRSIYFLNHTYGWAVSNGNILKSTDGGNSWNFNSHFDITFRKIVFYDTQNGWAIGSSNGPVDNKILKTTDGGSNWIFVHIPNLADAIDIKILNNNLIFVGGGFPAKLFKTTNGGDSWIICNSPDFENLPWCAKVDFLDSLNGIISCESALYRSKDGGTNWEKIPIYAERFMAVVYKNENIWAIAEGFWGYYILHSFDYGVNWVPQNRTVILNVFTDLFFVDDKNGWTIGWSGQLYKTTNGGEDSLVNPTKPIIEFPADNYIFDDRRVQFQWREQFGSLYHLQISEDSLFEQKLTFNLKLFDFMYEIGLLPQKLYYWRVRSENKLGFSDWTKILRFKTSGIIGQIINKNNTEYILSLNQNYPNPFNPSTTIKYLIPERSFVKIIIYNTLGEEVRKLVDEEKTAGSYEVIFDGSDLPSGIYLYRLESDRYFYTKKMILLK